MELPKKTFQISLISFFRYKESINKVDRVMSKWNETFDTLFEVPDHSGEDLVTSYDSLLDTLDRDVVFFKFRPAINFRVTTLSWVESNPAFGREKKQFTRCIRDCHFQTRSEDWTMSKAR